MLVCVVCRALLDVGCLCLGFVELVGLVEAFDFMWRDGLSDSCDVQCPDIVELV